MNFEILVKVVAETDSILTGFRAVYREDLINYLSGIIYAKTKKTLVGKKLREESEMVLERMAYFGLLDDDGKIVTGGYKNTLLRRKTVPEERERYDLYYLSYFRKRHRFNSLKLIKPVLESAHESLEFLYNGQIFSITHLRADSAEKIDEALGLMTAAPLLNIRSRTEPLEELLDETRDIKTTYIMPDSNQYLKLVDAVEQKGLSTLIERTRIAVFKGYSPSGYDFKINFI